MLLLFRFMLPTTARLVCLSIFLKCIKKIMDILNLKQIASYYATRHVDVRTTIVFE